MVTMIPPIPEPPTPQDPPAQFNQKAADSWAGLYAAIPKMNEQAQEVGQIGDAAEAAKLRAISEADLALGYRSEAGAARTAAMESAVAAGEHAGAAAQSGDDAEHAALRAEAAASQAENRVAMTGVTGYAMLPEGNDSQDPGPGGRPAGFALVRGSTQDPLDYKLTYWDRVASAVRVVASRTWVGQQITAAINALQATIDGWLGYTIIYPNGGSAASPANVSVNSRYEMANPFPGYAIICEAEILLSGHWGDAGRLNSGAVTPTTGVVARPLTDSTTGVSTVVVQTGAAYITVNSNLCHSPFGWTGGNVSTPTPCRVKVRKIKGGAA